MAGRQARTRTEPSDVLPIEPLYRSTRRVGGLTHSLYRYPARFSPELVAAAIEAFSSPGDTVLDPFMGGGTTAVEALARARRFVGFDINPLAVLLTRVKTDPLNRAEVALLREWATANHPSSLVSSEDVRLRNAPAALIEQLSRFVASVPTSSPRIQMAGRALLMDAAQWAIDGRQSPAAPDALPGALARSLNRLEEGMGELVTLGRAHGVRPSDFSARRVVRLGATQTLARGRGLNRLAGRVRLVVTSPPYPGVHVLYHRWQVGGRRETPMAYWLADANDGLGPKHYTMGGRSGVGEGAYFAGIGETWASVRRLLHKDAIVLQLVAFTDAEAQLPQYLNAMAAAGYSHRPDLEPQGWRDVPNRRWYYRAQPGRGSTRERLVVHGPGVRPAPCTGLSRQAILSR